MGPDLRAKKGSPPLIGVTTSEVRRSPSVQPTREGEPPQTEMSLGLKYIQAIEAAGGVPVILPPVSSSAVRPMMRRLDGICLSGGPDLDPVAYGEREHPQLGPVEPMVDRFELAVAAFAWSRRLPVLALCRGAQTLNVACGGSLYQHLPDLPEVKFAHRQTENGEEATHGVAIDPASGLARVMGITEARVNSFHHQAVARLGRGLEIVAWSDDGVVEGIEAPGRDFVIGVQWHAECLVGQPEHAALFSGLVEAADKTGSVPEAV